MSALVDVVAAGLAVTIQDRPRLGYRHIGVPSCGPLDGRLAAAANAMVGNDLQAAVLEIPLSGPTLKVLSGTVRFALAGDLGAKVINSKGSLLAVQAWSTATLFPGDTIQIGNAASGVAYVAVSGGFKVPLVLGCRSTYQRAALGGVEGRALAAGDRLPCANVGGDPWLETRSPLPLGDAEGPIRVILGPQQDHFSSAAIDTLLSQTYTVSRDMDRMGMRLDGAALQHNARGAEIISDGVLPGAIQVPPNGLPIILMADCQTSGGYPKIATVISADLPRLGHLRPGMPIRFAAVSQSAAGVARQAQTRELMRWIGALQNFRPPGVINEEALYGGNLISGAVRGDERALYAAAPEASAETAPTLAIAA